MKKLLKTLGVASLLLFLMLPALTSCGKCKHKESEWQDVVSATCNVAGVRAKVCSACGEELDREEYEQSHLFEEGLCVYCGVPQYGSQYLEYSEYTLDGEVGYKVIGRGNSTAPNVEIPSLRNGKPVLAVAGGAFEGDKTITSVSFGKNVKQIGEKAFSGCEALLAVTFHAESELSVMESAAFSGCIRLKAFAVPSGVTTIPAETFKDCKALTDLALHKGITVIGENALEGCDALVYSEENGVKYLGAEGAPHLLLVSVTNKEITEFTVPADTKIIGTAAFLGCTKLTQVVMPEGVLGISANAFGGCAALESLTLPSSLQSIGTSAFEQCIALTSLTLPEGVAHIGKRAFYKCTVLASIELPRGIKTVGDFAFFLTGLSYTEYLGGKYLGNAQNPHLVLVDIVPDLTVLTIHESTRVVANGALADEDAASILTVEVGARVVTLGAGAFFGCGGLETLTFATTDGWKIAPVYGVNPISISVENTAETAKVMTGLYKNDYWYR